MPQLESHFSQLNNRVATTGTASGAGTACSAAARLVVEGQAKCSSWWGDKALPKHNMGTENCRDTYCCTMLYMYRDMKRNIRQDSIRQNSMILVWILLFSAMIISWIVSSPTLQWCSWMFLLLVKIPIWSPFLWRKPHYRGLNHVFSGCTHMK